MNYSEEEKQQIVNYVKNRHSYSEAVLYAEASFGKKPSKSSIYDWVNGLSHKKPEEFVAVITQQKIREFINFVLECDESQYQLYLPVIRQIRQYKKTTTFSLILSFFMEWLS